MASQVSCNFTVTLFCKRLFTGLSLQQASLYEYREHSKSLKLFDIDLSKFKASHFFKWV